MGSNHEASSDSIKSQRKIFTIQSRQYKLEKKLILFEVKVAANDVHN